MKSLERDQKAKINSVSIITTNIPIYVVNGLIRKILFMDICLVHSKDGTYIKPISIHGILWLQTHFDQRHWDPIVKGLVKLSNQNAFELSKDAEKAKLNINCLTPA